MPMACHLDLSLSTMDVFRSMPFDATFGRSRLISHVNKHKVRHDGTVLHAGSVGSSQAKPSSQPTISRGPVEGMPDIGVLSHGISRLPDVIESHR